MIAERTGRFLIPTSIFVLRMRFCFVFMSIKKSIFLQLHRTNGSSKLFRQQFFSQNALKISFCHKHNLFRRISISMSPMTIQILQPYVRVHVYLISILTKHIPTLALADNAFDVMTCARCDFTFLTKTMRKNNDDNQNRNPNIT